MGENRKTAGEIHEMGVGGRWEITGIHDEGGREEGEDEDKVREGGDGV